MSDSFSKVIVRAAAALGIPPEQAAAALRASGQTRGGCPPEKRALIAERNRKLYRCALELAPAGREKAKAKALDRRIRRYLPLFPRHSSRGAPPIDPVDLMLFELLAAGQHLPSYAQLRRIVHEGLIQSGALNEPREGVIVAP